MKFPITRRVCCLPLLLLITALLCFSIVCGLGAQPPDATGPEPDWVDAATEAAAELPVTNSPEDLVMSNLVYEATHAVGSWIWETNTFDKQSCRFWRSFEVPKDATISDATIYITVDNGYRLFLDGREIGRGSDWRTITSYDAKWLLAPGQHILAVDAFNDRLAGGLMFGLDIMLVNGNALRVVSDDSWWVVPEEGKKWMTRRKPLPTWHHTIVVGQQNIVPWNRWPIAVLREPPLLPLTTQFWQRLWFQLTLLCVCAAAILVSLWLTVQLALQSREQRLLQRERARIARDIHDDLGARVTQLLLQGEVGQREPHADTKLRGQFDDICQTARGLSHSLDEIVWAVNSRRDTLRDFATYVCKFAQAFLENSPVRCRLDIEPDLPPHAFDLPLRRNLFLAVKEAINNSAKHSGATELFLRIHRRNGGLWVAVEDNGKGFDVSGADFSRNGLLNMAQRMEEVGGTMCLYSAPGQGFRVEFILLKINTRPRLQWLKEMLSGKKQRTLAEDPAPAMTE